MGLWLVRLPEPSLWGGMSGVFIGFDESRGLGGPTFSAPGPGDGPGDGPVLRCCWEADVCRIRRWIAMSEPTVESQGGSGDGGAFAKAFVPGLVLGLVVGLFGGVMAAEFVAAGPQPSLSPTSGQSGGGSGGGSGSGEAERALEGGPVSGDSEPGDAEPGDAEPGDAEVGDAEVGDAVGSTPADTEGDEGGEGDGAMNDDGA